MATMKVKPMRSMRSRYLRSYPLTRILIDGMIGAFGRFAGDILARGISIYLLALLGWRSWGKLADAAEYGDATNMLRLPIWPVYAVLAAGAGLCALILALQLLGLLLRGARA